MTVTKWREGDPLRIRREIFFSTVDGAAYTGHHSRESFISWCRRNGVTLRRPPGCRTLVVKKADLDFALRI